MESEVVRFSVTLERTFKKDLNEDLNEIIH